MRFEAQHSGKQDSNTTVISTSGRISFLISQRFAIQDRVVAGVAMICCSRKRLSSCGAKELLQSFKDASQTGRALEPLYIISVKVKFLHSYLTSHTAKLHCAVTIVRATLT